MSKPLILKAATLPDATVAALKTHFAVVDLPVDHAAATAMLATHGARIRGIALRKTRVDKALLDALPALEIIASYSAGLDNVDLPAARARGITVTNTSAVLAEDVADAALGLALAVTRDLVQADRFMRAGHWPAQAAYPLARSLGRMRVGIVGMGTIGQALARRLRSLGSAVAYTGPRPKEVPYDYFPDLIEMAGVCDMLVLTCALTRDTHHMVNAEVLEALGGRGFLVNVARGSVVDEAALIATLASGGIAGAALDVFETEPHVPQALLDNPRVVMTPHIGSGTEETRQAMADHMLNSLRRHFAVPVEG